MDVTQGVFKNTTIYGMTFIDKYSGIKTIITSEGYTSQFLDNINTNTSQTSTIISDDTTYYNNVEDCTLTNCNIETGRFINCNINGNTDKSNYIKNGYFSGCTFLNYTIDDGKFINCIIDDTNYFNNGFLDNENSDFKWTKPWTSGVWNSGVFDNPYGWYGGTFNGGTFQNSFWSGGTANGGTFVGITWFDGIVRYADFIDNCIFKNGVFNDGTFTNSLFNGGFFNDGVITNSDISGDISKVVINGGNIFDCNIYDNVDINDGVFSNDSDTYAIYNANVYNANMSNLDIIGGNFYNGKYNNINFYGGDLYNGFYYNITSSILSVLSEDGNKLIMEDNNYELNENTTDNLISGVTIHNGIFRNSMLSNTTIKNGNFTNCYSNNCIFDYSVYTDGNMLDCVWNDGYWNDGTFISNLINSGTSNTLSISVTYPPTGTTTTTTLIPTTTTTTTTTIVDFIITDITYNSSLNSLNIYFNGCPTGATTMIIYEYSTGYTSDNQSSGGIISPRQFSLSGIPHTGLTFILLATGSIIPMYSNSYYYDNSIPVTTTSTTINYNMFIHGISQGPDGGQIGSSNIFKAVISMSSLPNVGILSSNDIIVNGYLAESENLSNSITFELTIPAGSNTVESGFILTTPSSSSSDCVITSVSPLIVSGYDSNNYNVTF